MIERGLQERPGPLGKPTRPAKILFVRIRKNRRSGRLWLFRMPRQVRPGILPYEETPDQADIASGYRDRGYPTA